MADGFQLTIDSDLADRIERAAATAGVSRETYARDLLNQQLFDYDAYTWNGNDPRTTGTLPVDEAKLIDWTDAEPRYRAKLASLLVGRR